jgi:hypothetical protein
MLGRQLYCHPWGDSATVAPTNLSEAQERRYCPMSSQDLLTASGVILDSLSDGVYVCDKERFS